MPQTRQALAAIKAYMASRPIEDVRAHRVNVWEAVIQGAEGYDEEATAEADPSERNEEAVFGDGSRLWWNYSLHEWETGPEQTGLGPFFGEMLWQNPLCEGG